jgi:hypothetical protein
MKHPLALSALAISVFVSGCASSVNVAVDPASITDRKKFEADYQTCQAIAKTYDLSQETNQNAAMGGLMGAVGVAGIATAVAGAVFAPAIPFIIAGGAAGGGLMGGATQQKENQARENILTDCLDKRGYRAFSGARMR